MDDVARLDGDDAQKLLSSCALNTKGRARCSKTGHRFGVGEARLSCDMGSRRHWYTLEAAAETLGHLFKPRRGQKYGALSLQGLQDLSAEQRDQVYRLFSIPASAARGFDASHPPSEGADKPPPRSSKRRLVTEEVKEEAKEEAQGEPVQEVVVEEEDVGGVDEDGEPMNAYEREREERIAANRARMAALNLPGMAAGFADAHGKKPAERPARPRGLAAKRLKREPREPQRSSLRLQGIASDGTMVAEELRGGQIVLSSSANGGSSVQPSRAAAPREPDQPRAMPTGPLPFVSSIGNAASDAAFLQALKAAAAAAAGSSGAAERGRARAGAAAAPTHAQLRRLSLREEDVAKVTREGISHVAFHPDLAHLVVATGDKQGHVALWDVDKKTAHEAEHGEPGEDSGREDGVYLFRPHTQYISGLRWARGRLYTAAYDGVVRCMDPERPEFALLAARPGAEISAFDCAADGNTLLLGDNEGNVEVADARAPDGAGAAAVNLHDRKLNTLHLEPGGEQLVLSSSGDRSAAVWDLRKVGKGVKALASASQTNTILSAYWAPNGSKRVLTTGRDNTLRFYDGGAGMQQSASVAHNNNTGRWVMPFRASWGPGSTAACGSMKRAVDLVSASGEAVGTLSSQWQTAISSRNVFSADGKALAAATASGRLHIYR